MRTSRQQPYIFALASLLLLAAQAPRADEKIARTAYIFDTTTDRTPAVTAFPEYPTIARRDRIEGDVTVCFFIDSNGRIRRPKIQSSTHKIFRRAALRAIKASSFAPLAPNQVLATASTCRTYRFRLTALVE